MVALAGDAKQARERHRGGGRRRRRLGPRVPARREPDADDRGVRAVLRRRCRKEPPDDGTGLARDGPASRRDRARRRSGLRGRAGVDDRRARPRRGRAGVPRADVRARSVVRPDAGGRRGRAWCSGSSTGGGRDCTTWRSTVDAIDAALDDLAERGVPLIDREARAGGMGTRIAFLHPSAFGGVLVELVEESPPGDGRRSGEGDAMMADLR